MLENTANIGFEETLWKAADKLRGSMDASEYKHVVLGLIFLKYISDKFEMKYNELVAIKSIRVARHKVIMTVSNRANMIVSLVKSAVRVNKSHFIPAVYSMFDEGLWHTYQYAENAE